MIIINTDKDIFVVCDNAKYDSEHILQIIAKAVALSETSGYKITVVCVGPYNKIMSERLMQYGANRVVLYESDEISNVYGFCEVVQQIIKMYNPSVALFPASRFGKAVAAVLSTRFEAGLTADCIDIRYEDGEFCFYRAAINDSVVAKIQCINCTLKMATVKKDVFIKKQIEKEKKGELEKVTCNLKLVKDECFKVLKCEKQKVPPKINISKYSIVFCIGRGVKNEKTRNKLVEIAKRCDAGIIGTRAAVDEKYIDKSRQVGQSGKSISPKIYVGFGVSGASQHIVGIKNAKFIIAVNKDENAPIFQYADYSIVEDLDKVVEEMDKML